MNTPEATLTKANEFSKSGDDESAIMIITDFMVNSKKKIWTPGHEQLIGLFIELTVRRTKLKQLKEGLIYYRNLSQASNLESFVYAINKTKELVEDKFLKSLKAYQESESNIPLINDLEGEDNTDFYIFFEKEDLVNSQKFIWETYKILLDFTKTNSKLFTNYAAILKSAFAFCRKNKRTVEFKRLCDSSRGFLQTLIKTEKKQNFVNKVQINKVEVLKILIQMRLDQLDAATELEQWLEAFKTAEDINYLMEKYEKNSEKGKSKLNPSLKLEFYSHVEKLLWISSYPLYHSYSLITIKENVSKAKKDARLDKFAGISDRIVLATLATPFKNVFTNYTKIGDELYDINKEIETETCSRMMAILKLNTVPSRRNLINYIENNKILDNVNAETRSLFKLFNFETNPIVIAQKGNEMISSLEKTSEEFLKYSKLLRRNLVVRCLMLMSKVYTSISMTRLQKVFSFLPEFELEDIISESARISLVDCVIDQSTSLVKFTSCDMKLNLLQNVDDLFMEIIRSKQFLKSKQSFFSKINELINQEIQNESYAKYDAIISEIQTSNQELKSFLTKKNDIKYDLREKIYLLNEEKKRKQQEEQKLLQEVLRDEQKKKEYEVQVKKYVIEVTRKYTNTIVVDGKKLKLDDILKDLNKATEAELIRALEEQEKEFKSKKEKRFHQEAKTADYITREFRRRDYKVYLNNVVEEENTFNQQHSEEVRKMYEDSKGMKDNLRFFKPKVNAYFDDITEKRQEHHKVRLSEFYTNLESKIKEDLFNDLNDFFKKYIEDYRKQEEIEKKKGYGNRSQLAGDWGKGRNFVKEDKTPRMTQSDFNRSGNFVPVEEKPAVTTTQRFDKGKFVETIAKPEFISAKKEETDKITRMEQPTNSTTITSSNSGFNRGSKAPEVTAPITRKMEPVPQKKENQPQMFARKMETTTEKKETEPITRRMDAVKSTTEKKDIQPITRRMDITPTSTNTSEKKTDKDKKESGNSETKSWRGNNI